MSILKITVKTVKNLIKNCSNCVIFLPLFLLATSVSAATVLADKPLFSGSSVPGNVALVISAEFPTALGSAYTDNYAKATKYVGYFDSEKCYAYNADFPVVKQTLTGLLYNTGVNNSGVPLITGTRDSHWQIKASPIGITSTTAQKLDRTSASGTSVYLSTAGNVPPGDYTYESNSFNFPSGVNPQDIEITFGLRADDQLVDLQINGVSTGIISTASFSNEDTITIPRGKFTVSSNTIAIKIRNNGSANNPTGIRIDKMLVKEMQGGLIGSYFKPVSASVTHACNSVANGRWSGNFLNWILTQTVDPFRYALTGGYRSIDTVGLTVLEKAWASGQGGTVATPTITNNQTLISQSTPFDNLNTIKFKIAGLGNKFYFTSTGNNDNPGANLIAEGLVPAAPDATKTYQMFAKVKVCDPALLESNCTKYPNGDFKPTGLMQKNAMKLNFAAFGYLNDSNLLRDGGVLRAKMNAVGPRKTVPNAPDILNATAEWNEDTGIFNKNPDSVTAAASGVTRSGAINYLNEFGLTTPGYKTYDPVGELYYTAIRYFKNQGNVAAYSSGLNAAQIDGFPVIDFKKDLDDPIKYSCQANFVIGIGDTNTWADGNLPGASAAIRGSEPVLPAEVAADLTVNVQTATNKVGQLENLNIYGNLGQVYTPTSAGKNTSFLMAGLAYDAHTKDMRPNDFIVAGTKSKIQTLETYWLDVLESGDRFNTGGAGMRNQFWLTAKYGGFVVPEGYLPYAASALAPTLSSWDKDNNGDPDNYFRANNPQRMIDGLTSAFEDIASKVGGSSNAFAVSSPFVSSGSMAFATSYNPDGWTGNIIGSVVTFDMTGASVTTTAWNASDKLETQSAGTGWNDQRFIATSKCETINSDGTKGCMGVPFRLSSLLPVNASQLSASGDNQKVLNFLRGDRSNEGGSTGFRIRKSIFGDIVNSKVVVIGKPSYPYGESTNPGYASFKNLYKNRTTVAYVGANDGLLHAIKATNDVNGGSELFAYVPSQLFNGPSGTPAVDGVGALSKAAFLHHNYVDSTPVVADVNFGGSDSDWHSLLVGGLGKGGKGYYAIDVTDPGSLSDETALSAAVKWEFTHKDLGFSYGRPTITKVKINDGVTIYNGWAVIVASGYNNADNNGYFFILNASTGALIKQVKTYATNPSTDAGLATLNTFINNSSDFVSDSAYAGDLLGNVWRLDLKTLAVTNLANLTDGILPQPITTAPVIEVDQTTGKRYVFVGTGKLLDDSDSPNLQTQTFYAINDGSAAAFFTSAVLPTGVTFPIRRINLNNNSTSFSTTGITAAAANSVGWFVDLADKYRINVDFATNAGLIAFIANKTGGDECNPEGTSRTYLLSYSAGKSFIASGFVSYLKLANNVQFYKNTTSGSTNVPPVLVTSLKDGSVPPSIPTAGAGSPNFRLLNWRDLPTAD